ncbi:hypothetical protein B0H14DRAFT_3868883 [Mycena olivaceomarginata]|nr:hypothetical protein B0H14DRAFT_3868883 [Mycena olivaceomarginata]
MELNVLLTPCVDSSEMTERPTLVFKITASSRFTDSADVSAMRTSLDVNPKLIKAFGYIGLLIEVGTAISELNPIAKAVMGLVGIARSKFELFIAHNECVLHLVEEVGRASVIVADSDDPELDGERPHQRRVSQALFSAIYQCLHLLWTLSQNSLVKQLSRESAEAVSFRREELANLAERMKSNQQLDTQVTVFKISAKVTELHDWNVINTLRAAEDVGPRASKACLPDTRVALLSRIRNWALHPASARTLLLHGAAGKGNRALFAFNRSVPDRSSSQLIPSWAKHLAQFNSQYLHHLHTLHTTKLGSSDILDQDDAFLSGLAPGISDGRPIVCIIDALDECPQSEAQQLLEVLGKVVSRPLPLFVRFLSPTEEDTIEDIHKFVHAQLYHHPEFLPMVDDVAKAAQTLFECAAALCRELTATRRPTSTSKRRDFVRRLREGPVMSLYDSYRAILVMYFDEGEDPQLVRLFRRVMGWIFLVRKPQPRRVFRAFAAALLPEDDQRDVGEILPWLGSLLSGTTSDDDPISPLHTSLRDFLLDNKKSGTFCLDLGPHSQEELSRACLKIMNQELRFNICGLSSLFALNSEVKELPQKVEEFISPELRYACSSTSHHLLGTLASGVLTSPYTPPDAVVLEVRLFLQHKFLFWLEAHSCMQTLRDGPGTTLPLFLDWTMAVEDKQLERIVLDYIRFEKRFRDGYMLSAAQIYISGLTFAPRDSIVSRSYGPRFRELIKASGALDVVWPPSETLVIQGTGQVTSVAFSPDGTRVASGSADTIRVWDVATGQQIGDPLAGHTDSVKSVAFSPDGKRIASGSRDKTIRVWDAATGQQVGDPLTGHTDFVKSVVFSPDGTRIASGSRDRTIRVWDAATGQQVGNPLTDSMGPVAFSPDGTRIASGSRDRTIRVWDAATGQQVGYPFAGHTNMVTSVMFSPDGTRIASGSWDTTIRRIASGSWDMTLRVWDAATGQQVGDPLVGHTKEVNSVVFSPDGTHIASGSWDTTIRVWDAGTGQQVGAPPPGHIGEVTVAFSPDGTCIASGSADTTIRVWNAATGQQVGNPLVGHTEAVKSVAFSPDSTRIASGSVDTTGTWRRGSRSVISWHDTCVARALY